MIEVGAVYRHNKSGHEYRVIAVGMHSETLEKMVVYMALYASDKYPYGQVWCRPAKMWEQVVNGHPRFQKVK